MTNPRTPRKIQGFENFPTQEQYRESANCNGKNNRNTGKISEPTPNYAIKWTFTGFIVCAVLFGIMYVAVNADTIGLPGVSRFIRKSPIAPALAPFSGKQNILILGVDSNGSKTDPFEGTRSDTILVVSIDKLGKSVNAISIPRDSKIYISEGHGLDKINAAHAYGGSRLTVKTIENTFGIDINKYIEINFDGVKDFVQALGGVPVNVEKRMYYTDRSGGLYINLSPGYQVLNAQQAEGYLRFRHDAIGDIGRMRRQQWFVKGVIERLKSPEIISKIPDVIKAMNKNVRTDMSFYELVSLASFAKNIDLESVQAATLPGKPSNHGVVSYWILDPDKTQEIIDRLIYREEPEVTGEPLTISLLYSAKYEPEIESIKKAFTEQGFDIVYTSRSRNPHSQIVSQSSRAGFNRIAKIKSTFPALKTAQFIIEHSEYSNDSDYRIVLAD